MSQSEQPPGGGTFARDVGTRTGRAVGLIAVAVLVAVLLLRHSPSASIAATTTTTIRPVATTAPKTTTTLPTTTTTTLALSQVKVQVLNGASPTQPLAGAFTAKLKAQGYQTVTPNNATSAAIKTSVIYVLVAGFAPEANALAASLGLSPSAVATTVPAAAPIPASTKVLTPDLVLLVGSDLASKA